MFHEFGHAMHGLLSDVNYPSLSGTNVPRDFVEFTSQYNEMWAREPVVFTHYAEHYQTGAPMPQDITLTSGARCWRGMSNSGSTLMAVCSAPMATFCEPRCSRADAARIRSSCSSSFTGGRRISGHCSNIGGSGSGRPDGSAWD